MKPSWSAQPGRPRFLHLSAEFCGSHLKRFLPALPLSDTFEAVKAIFRRRGARSGLPLLRGSAERLQAASCF
jgi:hypothetical protein